MSEVVLDASALLSVFNNEPGHKTVEAHIHKAVISAVNLSEVMTQLIKKGMPEKLAHSIISGIGLEVIPFDAELAYEAAVLVKSTSKLGLSFGDRACLALAQSLNVPAITADTAWGKLDMQIKIKLIR